MAFSIRDMLARMNRFKKIAVLFVAAICSSTSAQYDPPTGYYNSATSTGSSLKSQLHNIIDAHTVLSYNDARGNLQVTDRDPNDADNIILVYERDSLDVSNLNGSVPGWDNGVSWNREHTWPRALGVNSSGPDDSDLHLLRPSDPVVNSDRANLHFGGAFGQSFGIVSEGGTDVWYPGDADAGMIARQMFYAAVRYDGSDSATNDLELTNGTPSSPRLGSLDRMIEWHYQTAPDDFELRRNDVIHDNFQGNRNPFVDRPEYAWSVFVDQSNDSRIGFAGTSVGSDGASNLVFSERILVGESASISETITLNKSGNDGTFFQVATSGIASSSLAGRHNNFRTGGTDSTTFNVGLSASTNVPGIHTGSVTIDNLDVTTAGGTGRGANDLNDVIDLELLVVDHANASLAAGSDLNFLSLDFGSVSLGNTSPTLDFDLFNLGDVPALTASLELDAIIGTGDTSSFMTDLATLTGPDAIPGGDSETFSVSLLTSCAGNFTANYLLSLSDEDLAGALGQSLVVSFTGVVTGAPLSGDYDMDGDVDNDDLSVFQMDFGSTTVLAADGNGNGIVDAADFTVWQDNFGNSHPACSVVPEPSGWALIFLGLSVFVAQKRR